jgi:hypothetical protein
MTDQQISTPSTTNHGVNSTNVFPLGRVVTNSLIDENEINKRISNTKAGNNLYPPATNDYDLSVGQHEPCLSVRRSFSTRRHEYIGGGVMVESFSTLNGFGRKSDRLIDLFDTLLFVGISSNRALYDSRHRNTEGDFAVIQGGLTTLKNTGTKTIRNGDKIMWTLPDPTEVRNMSRISIPIEPYDPENMKLSAKLVSSVLSNKDMKGYNSIETQMRGPLLDGSLMLEKTVARIMLIGLHMFMNAGLVVTTEDMSTLLDENNYNTRRRHSSEFADTPDDVKVAFFKQLGEALGAEDSNRSVLVAPVVDKQDLTNHEEHLDLNQFMVNTMFPSDDKKFEIFNVSNAVLGHSGDAADLVKMQMTAIENLLAGVVRTNEFYTNRIFGKSVTGAAPGQPLDAILGHYSM